MSTYSTGSGITNETTATRRELISAIERNRQYLIGAYAFDQVDFLLRDIMKHRLSTTGEKIREKQRTMDKDAPSTEKVEVSQAELAAALKRRSTTMDDFPAVAAKILKDITDHRDPDLDDGCVVIDASNDLWSYAENEQDQPRGWHTFGETHVYPYNTPKRPIERVDVEAVKSRATY